MAFGDKCVHARRETCVEMFISVVARVDMCISAATISHEVAQLAHCSMPVVDYEVHPKKYVRTNAVHCQICR